MLIEQLAELGGETRIRAQEFVQMQPPGPRQSLFGVRVPGFPPREHLSTEVVELGTDAVGARRLYPAP